MAVLLEIRNLVSRLWKDVEAEQLKYKRETVPTLFRENRAALKTWKRNNDELADNIRARYTGTGDPYGSCSHTEVAFTNKRDLPKYRFWLPIKSNFPEDADDNVFDRFVCYDSDDEPKEATTTQNMTVDAAAWANHGHIASAVTLLKRTFDALDIPDSRVITYYTQYLRGDTFGEVEEIFDSILAAVADELSDRNEGDDCGIYRLMLAEWFLNHSKRILPPTEQPTSTDVASNVYTYQELFCNRCFMYDCPLHGNESDDRMSRRIQNAKEPKILSTGDSCGPDCYKNEHSSQSSQTRDPTDTELELIDHAKNIFEGSDFCSMAKFVNTMTCFQISDQITKCLSRPTLSSKRRREPLPSDSQQQDQWLKQTDLLKEKERKGHNYTTGAAQNAYVPCFHPEGCCTTVDKCSCAVLNRSCEKHCLCSDDCVRRFPGCDCIGQCQPKNCWCRMANRECDPSRCTCAAKGAAGKGTNACQNVGMSRNLGKVVLVGVSEICGYGAFLWESVKKGEYIGEYVGEIISTAEGERRDTVSKAEYLFRLTKDFDCDAFRKGNALRMANHSSQPNMECKVLEVNGDTRIGMFANQDIPRLAELFFDYGEHYPKKGFKEEK